MSKAVLRATVILEIAALALAGWWAFSPQSARAQLPPPGCEIQSEECRNDMAHVYGGQCEGIDCYYLLEWCCPFSQ